MNILFLVRLWPEFGGGETVTRTLANEFVTLGHNVSVAYFVDSKISDYAYVDDRISTYKICNVECNQFFYDVSKSSLVEKQICDYILTNKIEIVINQWFPLEYTRTITTNSKAKVIKCLHTAFHNEVTTKERFKIIFKSEKENRNSILDIPKNLIKAFFSPIYESYLQRDSILEVEKYFPYIDKYVFLSSQFLEQYIRLSKHYQYRDLLYAIPNPLPIKDIDTESDSFTKDNIVLVVGRLEESCKNLSRAIKAWALIEKGNPRALSDWEFQIVGDGSSREEYEELVKNLGLKKVKFLGFENPIPYYQKAKIFLMTSSLEGFGMTLVEAQHFGVVPVVMDSFLSLHDIIIDGENGIITPNGDINAYSKAVKLLMDDDVLWKKCSSHALESCKKFEISVIAKQWMNLFNDLLTR